MHGVSLAKDVYRHIHMFRASVGQVPVMVPLCDCAEMHPHGDLLQSMTHSEYTVEDVFGPGQPLNPSKWCIHVHTLCHVLCKHIHRKLESSAEPNEGERIWQVLGANVRLVDNMLVLDKEDAPIHQRQQQRSTATQQIVSISKHRINPTRASCQELNRKNPLAPSPWLPACGQCQITGDLYTQCVPDADGQCDRCGSEWIKDDPVEMEWLRQRRAVLSGCHAALEVSTYYRPCGGCDAQKSFDGHDVGIFNFSDSTLFLHELMFQYLDSMAHSKTTFTGFYSMLQDQYARSGYSILLRSRRVFG
ncbi:hypothetical protein M9435_006748 [Picochlorum sp. BPE23]|nr:hypothetical protein M9435_006748 [Picochlorum sp. BPE23]